MKKGAAPKKAMVKKDVKSKVAAKKSLCGTQKGHGEKRCEIQGGGQEIAVMVG